MGSAIIKAGKRGWYTVKPALLRLPNHCVDCGRRTETQWTLRVDRLDWLTAVCTLGFVYRCHILNLQVPVCDLCPQARRRMGQILLALGGMVLGTAIGAIFSYFDPLWLLMIPILGVTCGILGFFFGREHSYHPPVRLKKFIPKNETVMIRFGNDEYEEMFVTSNSAGRSGS